MRLQLPERASVGQVPEPQQAAAGDEHGSIRIDHRVSQERRRTAIGLQQSTRITPPEPYRTVAAHGHDLAHLTVEGLAIDVARKATAVGVA